MTSKRKSVNRIENRWADPVQFYIRNRVLENSRLYSTLRLVLENVVEVRVNEVKDLLEFKIDETN